MKKKYLKNLSTLTLLAVIVTLLMAFSPLKRSFSSETRNPGSFNSVSLAMSANVQLIKSTGYKLEIEADTDDLEQIETKVTNNNLEIKKKDWTNNIRGKVNIKVYMPKLEGLLVSGSGNITTADQFMTDELRLSVTGSGNIKLDNNGAVKIKATITGSGSIELNGGEKADHMKLVITGSGSCLSANMKVVKADVNITGSGSAKVAVTDELNTYITGSGSVYYAGNPLINASSTGSGKTKHM